MASVDKINRINGFTSLEVLVVLIIVGIISVIIIGRSDIGRTDLMAQTEVIKSISVMPSPGP
jgi:prepilin-type N-terminal cleavage/methylation domain-containing protein